jgi:phosphoribosylanthranilate isomerase
MIIQIYEIQTPQEAEKCIELGVNHLGSVLLSQDTWRIPELREVIRLSEGTDIKNSIIPLFLDRNTPLCPFLPKSHRYRRKRKRP